MGGLGEGRRKDEKWNGNLKHLYFLVGSEDRIVGVAVRRVGDDQVIRFRSMGIPWSVDTRSLMSSKLLISGRKEIDIAKLHALSVVPMELVRFADSLIQCLSTDLLLFPKDYDKVKDAPPLAAPVLHHHHQPNRTDQADT